MALCHLAFCTQAVKSIMRARGLANGGQLFLFINHHLKPFDGPLRAYNKATVVINLTGNKGMDEP